MFGRYFIGCMGYPACKKVIWLPDFVAEATADSSYCENVCSFHVYLAGGKPKGMFDKCIWFPCLFWVIYTHGACCEMYLSFVYSYLLGKISQKLLVKCMQPHDCLWQCKQSEVFFMLSFTSKSLSLTSDKMYYDFYAPRRIRRSI